MHIGKEAEALALHFHCAGQPKRAFDYAVRAAELAWISLAFERAAMLFEQAAAAAKPAATTKKRRNLRKAYFNCAGSGNGPSSGSLIWTFGSGVPFCT